MSDTGAAVARYARSLGILLFAHQGTVWYFPVRHMTPRLLRLIQANHAAIAHWLVSDALTGDSNK
jgi:hypothetical protein